MTQKITYVCNGDYLIAEIGLSCTAPLKRNRFTQMAETHLRENNLALYNDMILEENLFPYLKEIGETADRRMEQMMTGLLEKNPAPDKAINQIGWVQHLNMLRVQAEEIIIEELIVQHNNVTIDEFDYPS